MLMVENFTLVNENTCSNDVNENIEMNSDTIFENSIKQGIKSLVKEPHQKTVEHLLNYSKSWNK